MKALTNINCLSPKRVKTAFGLLAVLYFMGCGINEAQRDFEQDALSRPHQVTEMTATGMPVEGEEADKSDWRIAPEFSGLVSIQSAPYPNPVQFNGSVTINLYVSGVQAVNGLRVFVYRPNVHRLTGPFYTETQPLNPGLTAINLSASDIARTGTEATNLYRIVIYDGSQSIISYGDVKVLE